MQFRLIIQTLKPYLPQVKDWINDLLRQHSPLVKPLSDFTFQRLPKYYSRDLINSTKIIVVDKIPMIPLADMGLIQFGNFEKLDATGVTYLNTIFVRSDCQKEEWLYFHELIHILQWRAFGCDDFLLLYGLGLFQWQDDYSKTPLEVMAYENQDIFQKFNIPFNVEGKLTFQIERYKTLIERLKNPTT
jgi:hypothetical protein